MAQGMQRRVIRSILDGGDQLRLYGDLNTRPIAFAL
jgi:hypothetical protein